MNIIIDIPDQMYQSVLDGTYCGTLYEELKNGTPLPNGAEILTKEAYSDLCLRASGIWDEIKPCMKPTAGGLGWKGVEE